MKDSKEYSRKVQKLYRSLKRKYPKPQKVIYEEPLEALVYAIISENMSGKAAQSAAGNILVYALSLQFLYSRTGFLVNSRENTNIKKPHINI